ncbi:MAG: alginate export family protein [Acidobacteriota bacterium]
MLTCFGRMKYLAPRTVGIALGTATCSLGLAAQGAPALPEDGCHVAPSIYCVWDGGDQRLDLGADTRSRVEFWDAHATENSAFYAFRTRVRARYTLRDTISLFGEFQDARLSSLAPDSSGGAAVYRRFTPTGFDSNTNAQDVRQGWLEVRPIEGLSIRGGRTDIKLGTQVMYEEPSWSYLKVKRASQRMVGTVGWSHGERSNDGGSIAYDRGGYELFTFGAMPTTGVFDVDHSYETQDSIVYGGLSLTAKRDTWLENTEVRPFLLAYSDQRPSRDGGLEKGVEVYTLGASVIGIYPTGPGNLDVFGWLAGQAGDYDGRNHLAGAGILEVGYQLPDVLFEPWLRAGLNVASGGSQKGDHNTFFNMLPTNHLYYGFADQLAFQNLLNPFVQLMLRIHKDLGLNVFYHYFALLTDDDSLYFGSGAFTKKDRAGAFGFGKRDSFGHHGVGHELDLILSWKLTKWLSAQVGYAHFFGGRVFEANPGIADPDLQFGYLQLALKY